jgi:formylglycine-generating enzyme required for sulfatase activity
MAGLAGVLAVAPACLVRPAPLGEALVVVQTDVSIPRRVDRLRVDVLGADGAVVSSRDLTSPSSDDWPISFSVVADGEDAERIVTVRLRAYPEGHVVASRDLIRASTLAPEPVAYASIQEACGNAPTLRLGEPVVLRRGAAPITTMLPLVAADGSKTCARPTSAGSAAAKIEITEPAEYRFEIVAAVPDGAHREVGGDTTLSVRKDCPFPTTQLACNDDLAPASALSAVVVSLTPGAYWVVTGGAEPAPADLTLLATRSNEAVAVPLPPPATEDRGLVEPSPGASIDRLVRLRLVPGRRGTVQVTLHGDCFGAPADVAAGKSCVEGGAPVPVDIVTAGGELTRAASPPAAWSGDDLTPCTATPRAPSALHDEEVCIPGGAFLMGDTLALTDLEFKSQPERVRVVEPFLLDKYELTVGRYREALRRGLVPIPGGIIENDAPFRVGVAACTWSDEARYPAAHERDAFPLNCITWEAARAVCTFLGSDLPSEDQWEYAATAAGRAAETQFPWGDELPDCERIVSDRSDIGLANGCRTADQYGPVAVDAMPFAARDRSPQDVIGLGGNVAEWLRTGFYSYEHPAWTRAGSRLPLAASAEAEAPRRALRGGDWASFALFATGSARRARPVLMRDEAFGFRCARPGR